MLIADKIGQNGGQLSMMFCELYKFRLLYLA